MQLKQKMRLLLIGCGLLSGVTLAAETVSGSDMPPAGNTAVSAFTPAQEARIGPIAADYLLAHPDILVQVSQRLDAQRQAQQAKILTSAAIASHAGLVQDHATPSLGPADARVVVVEFFDYQCIYCSRLAPVMGAMIKANPQVRFVFKEWPIFGDRWLNSRHAAKTGLQIWQQKGAEAYLSYHNALFATGHNEGKLTAGDIRRAASAVKFNAGKAADVQGTLDAINALAQKVGLGGTPGLVVIPAVGATPDNTTVIPGMTTGEALQAAIDRAAAQPTAPGS